MTQLLITIAPVLLAALLLILFGKNKKEKNSVPEGMMLLSAPPMKRYMMYGLGVFIGLMIGFFVFLAIAAGAWEESQPWISIVILLGLFSVFLLFLMGYIIYAQHVFFNAKEIWIGRPFRSVRKMVWVEIGKAEIKDVYHLELYDRDGICCVRANASMVNYDVFYRVVKERYRV